jgi:hypothetical protein
MGKCMSKLVVEGFAFLVIPWVHRERFVLLGGRLGGVRVGCERYISNGQ